MLRQIFLFSLSLVLLAAAETANAIPLSFELSIAQSNYRVLGTETAEQLMAVHEAGNLLCSTSMTGFVRMGSRQTCNGPARNYSMAARVEFSTNANETYSFRTGADWGRGGGVFITDLDSGIMQTAHLTNEDIWWRRNWNNSDVIFTNIALQAGSWAITWLGFEGCCAGETTIQYLTNGQYRNFTQDNFGTTVDVTEASTILMLGLGITGVLVLRRIRNTDSRISKLMSRRNATLPSSSH